MPVAADPGPSSARSSCGRGVPRAPSACRECGRRLRALGGPPPADSVIGVTFYSDTAPDFFGSFARAFIAMFRIMLGRCAAPRRARARDAKMRRSRGPLGLYRSGTKCGSPCFIGAKMPGLCRAHTYGGTMRLRRLIFPGELPRSLSEGGEAHQASYIRRCNAAAAPYLSGGAAPLA